MLSSTLYPVLLLIAVSNAFLSNIPEINKLSTNGNAKIAGAGIKTPQDLLYSGDYVCDKFSSTIQGSNDTTEFPIDFNLYVANNAKAPEENYTVDLYFKNPNHQSLNDFAVLNASDSKTVLERYNPQLISKQPGFGVEFKFNFSKGLLCQFLYQFTVMYQLEKQDDHSKTSDKIFLVGSCQENMRYHPDAYNDLVSQGFRCVEYNSGYKYDGGKDWCTEFYPSDQCCKSYQNDELTDRDTCPASGSSSSAGSASSSGFVPTTFSTLNTQSTGQASSESSAGAGNGSGASGQPAPGQPGPGQNGPGQSGQF